MLQPMIRIIVSDANINGINVIDGGYVTNVRNCSRR